MEKSLTSAEEFIQNNLVVHHKDPKTGATVKVTPYLRHCHKERGVRFERDGKVYNEDWSICDKQDHWFDITSLSARAKMLQESEDRRNLMLKEEARLEELKKEITEAEEKLKTVEAAPKLPASGSVMAHEAAQRGDLQPKIKPQGGAPTARGA
jgi:hypothetical protein